VYFNFFPFALFVTWLWDLAPAACHVIIQCKNNIRPWCFMILYHFDQLFMACDLWPPRRDEHLFGRRQAAWQDQILFGIANFGRILAPKAPKILCHRLRKVMWPVTKRPTLHFGKPCDLWPKSWSKWYSSFSSTKEFVPNSFGDIYNAKLLGIRRISLPYWNTTGTDIGSIPSGVQKKLILNDNWF